MIVIGTPEGSVHGTGTCIGRSRAHEDRVEQRCCSGAARGAGCEGEGLLRLLQRHVADVVLELLFLVSSRNIDLVTGESFSPRV